MGTKPRPTNSSIFQRVKKSVTKMSLTEQMARADLDAAHETQKEIDEQLTVFSKPIDVGRGKQCRKECTQLSQH